MIAQFSASPVVQRLVRHKLAVLLALAVVVRLVVFFAFPSVFAWDDTGAIHGSGAYDTYARNLMATGHYGLTPGVSDALLPPAYSVALAGIYGAFGRSSLAVALWHISLDVLTIYAVFELGRRLFRGWGAARAEAVGWLAGLFTAFYPYLVFQNLTLIDTPLFMALLYLWLLMMVALRDRKRLSARTLVLGVLGGVVLGIGTLVRPALPPLAVLVAIWFLFRLPLGQAVLRLLPVAAASLLVLGVWAARSSQVYGEPVLLTINSGANFFQGNSPDTLAYLRAGYDVQWIGGDLGGVTPNTPESDRALMQQALAYLRANPGDLPELVWRKFAAHWSIDVFPYRNPAEGEAPRPDYQGDAQETTRDGALALGGLPPGDPVAAYSGGLFDQVGRLVHMVYFGVLLALAVPGLVVSAGLWRDVALLWFVQLAMTAVYVLFHSSTRYRVPTDPALFLFSGAALVWLAGRWRARQMARSRKQPAAV
jgi:4-amino-4-deoxy-L-arabinose transferase-like glycosyltransferase